MRALVLTILTSLLSYSTYSQKFDVDTIQYNGSSDTLINVVILGDGYTQNQLGRFVTDAHNASNALFNETPIKVPSNVSGAANHPDNLIDNYFGSSYNAYYEIERLLVPMRSANVTNVLANNFPSYDQVLMIVNDSRYGGSGGWMATFSTNSSSSEIFLHELGHSFAYLIDEYWAGAQYAHEGINMTQETNIAALVWKNWYGDFGIGLYPHSESPKWYRPHQNCKMRFLGPAFCSVCREGIIERIHSLVSPLVSYHPRTTRINLSTAQISFKLNLIKPDPNTLHVEWRLNNSQYKVNSDSIKIDAADFIAGLNNLSVTIEDTTEFLRVDNHNSIHLSVVNWNIEIPVTGIENAAVSSKKMDFSIFPNPFHDYLTIEFKKEPNEKMKVEIIDMMGRIKVSETYKAQKIYTLNTKSLDKGYYLIMLYSSNILIATHKIVKN